MSPPSASQGPITAGPALAAAMEGVASHARASGLFADVRALPTRVECDAKGSAAPATYRLELDAGRLWVTLATPDRWLSHSIEADLLHTGDDIDELFDEELAEIGLPPGNRPDNEHFRDQTKQFIFRSALAPGPGDATPASADTLWGCLRAYEACFRRLGDMEAKGDE